MSRRWRLMGTRAAGWYADPVTVGAARYWDGRAWTTTVTWGGVVRTDPTPLSEVIRRDRAARAEIVSEHLDDVAARGVVGATVVEVLRRDLRATTSAPGTVAPAPVRAVPAVRPVGVPSVQPAERPASTAARTPADATQSVTAPVAAPLATSRPVAAPLAPPAAPAPAAVPIPPARIARWWAEARRAVRTDLALHGLAYLGVLLVFAGVTGLIVFSFGDVTPWVRPLTELLVPTALLVAAHFLDRRGAAVVAAALTLLGGAIAPIVVAASLTDGASFPPDLSGPALPLVQGAAVLALAVAGALVVRRAPSSPLRFLVAPVAWLAVGLAAAATRDPVPAGYDAARPDALQLAAVLAAITASVLLSSWRRVPEALATATRQVALPSAAVVAVLELVLAGDEGWPVASTLVAGLATLLLLELSVERITPRMASIGQFVVVAVTAVRLSAVGSPEWIAAGAALVLVALVEYTGHRRATVEGTVVGLILVGVEAALTLAEPGPLVVTFGAVTAWTLWRHVRPPDWLPWTDAQGFVPASTAAVTMLGIRSLIGTGPTLWVTGGLVLSLALAGRISRAVRADRMWTWFVPASAATLVVASTTVPWGALHVEVASAAAMSALALAATTLPAPARLWAVAATAVWSLANLAEVLDAPRDVRALALGAAGLTLVLGSLRTSRPVGAHVASIGHLAGLGALLVPAWPGWVAVGVVGLATAGWIATAVVDERGEAVLLATARRVVGPDVGPVVDHLAPLLSFVGCSVAVVLALHTSGAVTAGDPWTAVNLGALALALAEVARSVPLRRARAGVLAWVALLVAVGAAVVVTAAVGSDAGHWAPVVGSALVLAVVAVDAAPRPIGALWVAWVAGGTLAVLVVDRLGLDRDHTDLAVAAWGATALLLGLGLHRRRHGPISTGHPPAARLLPPIMVGAAAFVVGGTLGLTDGTATEIGWTAAGLAVVVLVAALLVPLGALLALAEVLATASYVALVPWDPGDRPWTLAPWVVLLLAAAWPVRRTGRWTSERWDLPSFVVAHLVAGAALVTAIGADDVVRTSASFAAISFAVAAALRRRPWALAGAVLALAAAFDAGHGWLALVLGVEGIAVTVVGMRSRDALRWALLGAGAAAFVGAWLDLVVWVGWTAGTVYLVTMPSTAILAVLAAVARRTTSVHRELATVWVVTGAVVSVGSVALAGEVDRLPGGLVAAGSLLALAAAAALLATVWGAALRWVCSSLAAIAWVPLGWAVEPSARTVALVGTGVAVVVLAVLVGVHGSRPGSAWSWPAAGYAVVTQLTGAAGASAALPDIDAVVVVLLAVAAELVAFGVLTGWRETFVVAPWSACAAWLVYAQDALRGNANWFTIPIGVTLLVVTGLLRWIRRGRGGDVVGYDVIVLELVGMSVLVGSPLALTLAGHLWNGTVATAIGVGLAGWGITTRVRWRAGFGAATVVLALVLMIGVPLSHAVTWSGPMLWITLSVAGILAIVVATALESSRDRVRRLARHLDEMTDGWERIPTRRDDRHHRTPPFTPPPVPGGGHP